MVGTRVEGLGRRCTLRVVGRIGHRQAHSGHCVDPERRVIRTVVNPLLFH